jgi:hypothetical protein
LHGVNWAIPGRRIGGETRAPEGCAGAGGEVEDLEVSDTIRDREVRLVRRRKNRKDKKEKG